MSKLEIEHITHTYWEAGKPVLALQDLSLSLAVGEFVTLIGPSGSGKSTLLELIVGLLQPEIGQIRINGQTTAKRLGQVAYMPQQDALLPWRTVLENVILAP